MPTNPSQKLTAKVKAWLPHAERGETGALERLRALPDTEMLLLRPALITRIATAFATDAERARQNIPPAAEVRAPAREFRA